ncbi:hypothetical protein ACLI1A_08500 [Flavobacterium sp. RHBU_3]|uniref:hypothetical protein n=1 Tax=Flavobacterium sp. RHBU_3 TaxID=3391184 RepID=UPI003984F2AE
MEKKYPLLFALAIVSLFVSCGPTEEIGLGYSVNVPTQPEVPTFTAPTAQQFSAVQATALENRTQHFTIGTNDPWTSFTSEKGVIVWLSGNCFTLNGVPVTGDVNIDYVELFDRGNMLVTNKTTMGVLPNGDKSLLLSGGEVYINVTQNGQQLDTNCGLSVSIPTSLTGGTVPGMLPWKGTVDAAGNVVWEQQFIDFWVGTEQGQSEESFNAYLEDFGWFNCDKFYNFEGPKTDVEIIVPQGYNNINSQVFVALVNTPNTLGNLSGEYPIGLQCHLIFVTGDGADGWIYAIKSVTLPEDASYTFTPEEFITATETEVVAAINALP